jgi:hypothetical protein
MAADKTRTTEVVRLEIESERERLAEAVEALREGLADATDVAGKLRNQLPLVAAGALGAGFVVAGGVGTTKARFGRFSLVDRS